MYICLLFIFFSAFFIQLIYYIFIYGKFARRNFRFKETKLSNSDICNDKFVSVIICAKNEGSNLRKNLTSILTQKHPTYEVIVVDDCSVDDTESILYSYKNQYTHLQICSTKEIQESGKKSALIVGIEKAKYEFLLFTDADCVVHSNKWVSTMTKYFVNNKQIVLGYGPYQQTKENILLNSLIRFDAFFIALQYFSFTMIGFPYMGVGRNMAYRKSFFEQNNGFDIHPDVQSGTDDLLINRLATLQNTSIVIEKDGFVYSESKKTFKEFIFQKGRHFTTFRYYKKSHKLLLGGEFLSRISFFLSTVFLIIFFIRKYSVINNYFESKLFLFFLLSITLRIIVQLLVFNKSMKHLKEKILLLFSLFFDLIMPILNFIINITHFLSPWKTKWK